MAAEGDGHIKPYAFEPFSVPGGPQVLAENGPETDLAGYGTAEGTNEDHRMSYAEDLLPRFANDATRASNAGKPDVSGGETECDPFDTVPGMDGQSPWTRPDPVYRRPGSTTQRP